GRRAPGHARDDEGPAQRPAQRRPGGEQLREPRLRRDEPAGGEGQRAVPGAARPAARRLRRRAGEDRAGLRLLRATQEVAPGLPPPRFGRIMRPMRVLACAVLWLSLGCQTAAPGPSLLLAYPGHAAGPGAAPTAIRVATS